MYVCMYVCTDHELNATYDTCHVGDVMYVCKYVCVYIPTLVLISSTRGNFVFTALIIMSYHNLIEHNNTM